jgi:hypothetical protein
MKVVELFCCLVDAHFTHITLSTKAQEIIADVLQLIETQVEDRNIIDRFPIIHIFLLSVQEVQIQH